MKNRILNMSAIIVAALLALPAASTAQQATGQKQAGQQGAAVQQGKADKGHPGAYRQVSGEILKEKEVALKGTDTRHKVVLIKTDQGRRATVDLGPVQDLKNVQLQSGKKIKAEGYVMRVGDRSVLFAGNVNVDGKALNITRHLGKTSELQGKILREKQVGIKGSESKNQVVMLKLDKGQRAIVDLGPTQKLQKEQVQAGKTLTVVAHPVVIGDRLIWMADEIVAGTQRAPVQRPENWLR